MGSYCRYGCHVNKQSKQLLGYGTVSKWVTIQVVQQKNVESILYLIVDRVIYRQYGNNDGIHINVFIHQMLD